MTTISARNVFAATGKKSRTVSSGGKARTYWTASDRRSITKLASVTP